MTDQTKLIRGSGGPPKPPPPPYRAPDTLHSRSFATVQDLISEGEIEGFASASKAGLTKGTTAYDNASLKDIFLNDTPILNSTASNSSPANTDFNFRDVGFKSRFGTSNQTAMSGIAADTRSPTGVGVVVTTSSPVTRQITNTDTNAVIVTLTWPQIQVAEDDGDLRGDTVEYKIQIQHDSGGFVDKVGGTAGTAQVSGRTADAYARDHRIELTSGFTTVDIRVVRVTADSTESNRVNAFQFTSFQEVLDNSSTYANSAYTALRFDSKQFDRIPSRKYRIRGIKVRIPGAGASGTGTPTVDIQTGRIVYPSGYVFNGVMGAAVYTNCPAMCLLDLLTNTRYGLGNHIVDSNIDLFSFVAASKYANEEVDDGTGSGAKEARFSCNVNIQSPKEAFAAINDLAGVMRCMPIWSAGGITLAQDKETSASYLFNLANVGEGGFSYSGSSLKTRNSVISVSYFNMDSKEVDFEVVEDATAISKFGAIVKKVKAFACTSRNQAARLGRAILFAEQNESETVSFTTSIDAGVVVRPGSVIEINDPVRAGARRGGRVVSATTTTVTIDALEQTGLPALNDNPTISVILSDGTVESKTITDITGAVLTVNSAFSSAPSTNAPYLISSTTLQTQLFRVVQVEEQDEVNYVITALSYVEGKYAFIENGTTLPTRTISILNQPASPPSNLTVSEQTVVINNIARSKLIVDWQPVVGVTQYLVNYKISNGNYVSQVVFSSDFELLDTVKATYTIQVFSYNALGEISANPTETTFTAKGKTAIPGNVQNLTIEPVNEQFVRLRFRQATALDVLHGGRVYVRHSNQTGTNATFQSSQDIIEAVAGNATEVIAPALSGTYLLKFQDDGGRFSAVEAKTTLSLVNLLDSVVVETDREDTDGTPYNGAKSNVVYDSSLGGLKLTDPTTNTSGTYDFVDTLDLGNTFSLTLKRHFQGEGFYVGDEFDNRTDNIDTWTDFDGSVANEANAKIAVRTTTDDPSGSPTYTDFNDFANGTFRARGFQFRITLETSDTAQNMNLQQAGYTATMQSRTEQSSVIASGAGAKAVTFTAPFFVGTSALGNLNSFLPSVNISAQNMASGDYFELSNISGTGFTVHFKNSSNASIDRNFTYSAVGFGKGG
jgi:predicted phage tail protein